MNIYSEEGSVVVYKYPDNGNAYDQRKAGLFLRAGNEYVVDEVDVHSFSSSVKLKEFPKEWFNTVLFEDF